MTTNRTKTDKFYRRASKLYERNHTKMQYDQIRAIAAALRDAYREGMEKGPFFKSGECDQSYL